jgi:hypothetical protein
MNGREKNNEIFEDERERARYAEVELALHRAMGRMDAPSGFADRVMTRTEARAQPARSERGRLLAMPMLQWRTWAAGAIAAVLVVGVVQSDRIHQEHERQAQAQAQFEAAERITDQALAHVRAQVEQAGISLQ